MATEVINMIKDYCTNFYEYLGINTLTKFIIIAGAIITGYLTINELSKKITNFIIENFKKNIK